MAATVDHTKILSPQRKVQGAEEKKKQQKKFLLHFIVEDIFTFMPRIKFRQMRDASPHPNPWKISLMDPSFAPAMLHQIELHKFRTLFKP